jgi:hypothetical protein
LALPVRPQVWPPAPTDIQPGRNDARMAAQKAFFDAALAGKAATATSGPTTARRESSPDRPTTSAPQAVRSVAAAEARASDRIPPPGSIINILV